MDTNFCPNRFCRKFRPFMFFPSTSLATHPFADFGVPGISVHFPLSSVLFLPISVQYVFSEFSCTVSEILYIFINSVHFLKFRPKATKVRNGQKKTLIRGYIYIYKFCCRMPAPLCPIGYLTLQINFPPCGVSDVHAADSLFSFSLQSC